MFKFKLQPVLRYREWIEEEKIMTFAERQRIHETEKAKAKALREMRAQYFEALREEASKEEISVTFLSFYHSYIFVLERRMTEQDEVVAQAREAMLLAQEELIEAKKQKEIMAKLKQRAFNLFRDEEARIEQIGLDDFSSIKFIRTRNGLNQFAN